MRVKWPICISIVYGPIFKISLCGDSSGPSLLLMQGTTSVPTDSVNTVQTVPETGLYSDDFSWITFEFESPAAPSSTKDEEP